jgi:hypothetical protein
MNRACAEEVFTQRFDEDRDAPAVTNARRKETEARASPAQF